LVLPRPDRQAGRSVPGQASQTAYSAALPALLDTYVMRVGEFATQIEPSRGPGSRRGSIFSLQHRTSFGTRAGRTRPKITAATSPPEWRAAPRNISTHISSTCDFATATAATCHTHKGGFRPVHNLKIFPKMRSAIAYCIAHFWRIPDKQTLTNQTAAWKKERNGKQAKIDWQFKTADARIKLKHLYPKNRNSLAVSSNFLR
jgi:hypothetical protein